jgi:hypothetical protein
MLEEVMDLSVGAVVVLLPLLLLALPGIALFVVLPAILLLAVVAPLAVIGAVLAGPPYLVARWLRRHRRRTTLPPAGHADSAPRSTTTSGPAPVRRLAHG